MAIKDIASVAPIYGDKSDARIRNLADRLELTIREKGCAPQAWHLCAIRGELTLTDHTGNEFNLDHADILSRMKSFHRSGLARACGIYRGKKVLDALGGWGTDSACLAKFGANVTLCEINPLVFTMCRNRFLEMNLDVACFPDDATDTMRTKCRAFDVIYLDDMFSEHPTKALPAKSMQILAELAATCDLKNLWELALKTACERVVVKRRRNQASELPEPDWSIKGSTVRFDVYRSALK